MPDEKGKQPTFDFLGITHYWTKSQRGNHIVKRRTMKKKLQKAIKNITDACRLHRHEKLKDQCKLLSSKLRGLYQYYDIRGNYIAIYRMYRVAIFMWFKWLNRRSQRNSYTWKGYAELLRHFKLSRTKIIHSNV
ncbi:hypothetical protein DMA11_17515 [Marinilabiliaceae bacterium JC017]|nr:hypothetical protein DMA11_17515 [Marinilabiliaceae bacterium JC017]